MSARQKAAQYVRLLPRREINMAGKLFLYMSELAGSPAAGLAAIWDIGVKEQSFRLFAFMLSGTDT